MVAGSRLRFRAQTSVVTQANSRSSNARRSLTRTIHGIDLAQKNGVNPSVETIRN